jgi:hypothetical protein
VVGTPTRPEEPRVPQTQTVLTSHQSKSGSNAKGGWTMHIFKTADGTSYQTFDTALGNKAYGLLNQPVSLIFESETRGDYTNNVLKSIDGAAGAAPAAPAATAAATAVAPIQTGETDDQKQVRIMRQSALERAILAGTEGYIEIKSVDDLYALSDQFLDYFKNGRQGVAVAEPAVADSKPIGPSMDDVGF